MLGLGLASKRFLNGLTDKWAGKSLLRWLQKQ